jgi:hypothetical protein
MPVPPGLDRCKGLSRRGVSMSLGEVRWPIATRSNPNQANEEKEPMRKPLRLLAIATVLVAAVAFPAAASATQTTTIDPTAAPSGTHLQTGTIGCTVTASGVSCSSFELAGVGHTNATLLLTATYTATIDCTNKGGNLVEVHSQDVTVGGTPVTLTSDKNGRLTVPPASVTAPTEAQVLEQAACPNPNWTPSVHGGAAGITLSSFTYTLTFEDFDSPYITITGNDP